ncbi:MAG: DUF6279 family lipoprotein [Pseudomonadota bacterium]|nr:DUF6279 family lipoprotein [Pseudomonadota bacterium]
MKAYKFFLLTLVFIVLSSCTTKFLYNQLDRLIIWRVDQFVNLTDGQKQQFKGDLRAYLDLARKEQIPILAYEAKKTSQLLESKKLPLQSIQKISGRVTNEIDNLITSAVPLLVNLLSQLDPSQKLELFESLKNFRNKTYNIYSGETAEERVEKSNRMTFKTIERFIGRLDQSQEIIIQDSLNKMADTSEDWIAYQAVWQENLFALIDERPMQKEYELRLKQLLVNPSNLYSKEYQRRIDVNAGIMLQMTTSLIKSLNEKQIKKAKSKLNEYSTTLTRLAESS